MDVIVVIYQRIYSDLESGNNFKMKIVLSFEGVTPLHCVDLYDYLIKLFDYNCNFVFYYVCMNDCLVSKLLNVNIRYNV